MVTGSLVQGVPQRAHAVDLPVVSVPATSTPATSTPAPDGDPGATVRETPVVVAATPSPTPAPSAAPTPSASPTAAPVDPVKSPVAADRPSTGGRVETPPLTVDPARVQTVGLTWPTNVPASELAPQIRTGSHGQWSAWQPFDAGDSAPDSGSADARHQTRAGTDSVWVGGADALQISFKASSKASAADVRLALVGSSPTSTTTASPAAYRTSRSGMVRSDVLAPTIVTRDQWGARPQVCTPDVAPALVGAVVHHTANANTYTTMAEAEQQIRNDQAYHIDSRGWCDIGYNFVVDKWGNIYEGRANSMTEAVVGVHAGGFNTGTVGVAMLGTFSTQTPSAAMVDAVGRIIGWRLGAYGIDPNGTYQQYTAGGETSRYANQTVTLPRVMGHRDVDYTDCPGDQGYAALGTIRATAAAANSAQRYAAARSLVRALYVDLLGREGEPAGVEGWAGLVVSGASAGQMVTALTGSTEYAQLRVTAAYKQVLGRDPDASGLAGWVTAIQQGRVGPDDVARLFYESPEFYLLAGNEDHAFVTRLYERMLGREPSAAEVAYWVARVPSLGRGGVAYTVWQSMEAAQQRSAAYYQTFLGRAPEWNGMVYWAQVMLAQGESAVRVGIAGSTEYWQRAITRYP
ncbi:DUF4214 domain-containing protein [Cellulomonas sp. NTE-D12]|uniref:DUF4214 domain-containing protein n=1 Tax=Cellulomonas sp. NTE-D12 TaxID=2962632 RepID=UPI003081570C